MTRSLLLARNHTLLMMLTACTVMGCGANGNTDTPSATPSFPSAVLFEPGVIATGREFALAFAPDGRTIYFTRFLERGALRSDPASRGAVFWATRTEDGWTEPQMAPFAGDYSVVDPSFSPDGSIMFFMTNRPLEGTDPSPATDIYVVEGHDPWDGTVWNTAPRRLDAPINTTDSREGSASLTSRGELFFFSERAGGFGQSDIYVGRWPVSPTDSVRNLGEAINSTGWEGHPHLAYGASVLIFISDRDGGSGSCDLYASRRTGDTWSAPVNLGASVNTTACEITPVVNEREGRLYFARQEENGDRNLYVIDIGATDIPADWIRGTATASR